MCGIIRKGSEDYHVYNLFLWLAGVSRFNTFLKAQNIHLVTPDLQPSINIPIKSPDDKATIKRGLKRILNRLGLKKSLKKFRKKALKGLFLIRHLPEFR